VATASLVLGVVSVPLGFTGVVGVLAIVLGVIALRRIHALPSLAVRGDAIAGAVLGVLSVSVWIVSARLDGAPVAPEVLALVIGVVALVRFKKRPGSSGIARGATWLGLLFALFMIGLATLGPTGPLIVAPAGAPYRYTAPYDYNPAKPHLSGRYRTALVHVCGYFVAPPPPNCFVGSIEVAILHAPSAGDRFALRLDRPLKAALPTGQSLTYAGTYRTPAGLAYLFNYRDTSGHTRTDHSDYWIPIPDGRAIRVECSPTSIMRRACRSLLRTLHTTQAA
jgi:hypothetical protein